MRDTRVFAAGAAFGASVAGAVWVFNYRATQVYPLIDETGSEISRRYVHGQPWWSTFGAVGFLVVGTALLAWLLPEDTRLARSLRRFRRSFVLRVDREEPTTLG